MPRSGAGARVPRIGIGLGVLGAAAASSYAYADDCRLVRVYNSYGEYIGRREICR